MNNAEQLGFLFYFYLSEGQDKEAQWLRWSTWANVLSGEHLGASIRGVAEAIPPEGSCAPPCGRAFRPDGDDSLCSGCDAKWDKVEVVCLKPANPEVSKGPEVQAAVA